MRLTRVQMSDVLADFGECVTKVLESLSDEGRSAVIDWMKSVALLNSQALFRPDNMAVAQELLLRDETMRNFMLDLQFRFFTLAGDVDDFVERLSTNLSDGLIVDGPISDYNQLPSHLKASMPLAFFPASRRSGNWWVRQLQRVWPRAVTLRDFLINNPLLVIVLLVQLTYEEPQPESPQVS